MPGYLDYGIPASWNPATWGGRGRRGVARSGPRLRSPFSLSVYRGALERPLIPHRLEKPEIKKGIYVDIRIRRAIPEREKRLAAAFGTGSAFHLPRCSPSHPCFRSFHDSLRIRRTRSNERTIIRDERHHHDNNVAW